jgi:hypothetical protein
MFTLPKLEQFLLEFGSARIENFFQVLWLVQAYSYNNKKDYFDHFERVFLENSLFSRIWKL